MTSKSYKHIFFDLDRTLWDFETNSKETLRELYEETDLRIHGIKHFETFLHAYRIENAKCWEKYRHGYMTKEELRPTRFNNTLKFFNIGDQSIVNAFDQGYVARSPHKTALLPGAVQVLDYLRGDYKMHIITNGFVEVQHIKLKNCGLTDYFEQVVISEETPWKKPAPEVFHHACELAGADISESLMVGDDMAADIKGAKNAGMDQVFYNPTGAKTPEDITFVIKHLDQLRDIL